ncbi:MAG TPA: hypothetical protein VKQ36_09790 [Ktedonobacterales bacterium]|nr:hypothetical protein [Ktedonobacterales bacterium]
MSLHALTGSAISAVIAGVIAAVIYEVIYFLTSNHQVRAGLPTAAIIGAMTVLIAFVVGLIFWQVFQRRS